MDQFRTGWFVESVISAAVIVLVVRTRKPFWQSRPGKYLLLTTAGVVAVALILPFLPFDSLFGFNKISPVFVLALAVIVFLYILFAEIAKRLFYRLSKN